ncbi:MAG: IPT/TIG domain-containing protein [Anaeromyxobacteraceae bacterium]
MSKIAVRVTLAAVACAVVYGAYTAYDTLTGDSVASPSASASAEPAPVAAPVAEAPRPSRPAVVPETSRGIAEDPGTPPKIQSVSPATGSAQGGERVVIKGHSFARPQVLFGNSPAQVVEATEDALTVVVPAPEHAGAVALVVTNRSGGYTVRPNAYTYNR